VDPPLRAKRPLENKNQNNPQISIAGRPRRKETGHSNPFFEAAGSCCGFVGFTASNFAALQLVATPFLPNGLFAILAAFQRQR
jgi:hypothetical protein